ncbi:MAG: GreA/GreB family elongation factor [Elusimicrobiota bacterium]|jgi:transcription elongation GreA/GreB family factor
MSRAFIKEDAGSDDLPERVPPSGPNYVTPEGLSSLRGKVHALESRGSAISKEELHELRYWRLRLGGAVLVDNSQKPPQDIRFGALVEASDADGRTRRLRIVGQDEAEENGEKISWDSVQARAMLGLRPGDAVPGSEDGEVSALRILSVSYP